MVVRPSENLIHQFDDVNRYVPAAGILPGSVLTRYDLLGTYVHGRLQ